MSDMQEKLRAISSLNIGRRIIGEKPFGERMIASSANLTAAQKAEAKRKYNHDYYVKHGKPKKKRGGAK